jgi:hypothetical protein
MPDSETIAIVVSGTGLFLLVIAVLIGLFVFFRLFRLGIRWLRWSAAQAPGDPIIVLICFAAAAYLYPHPLTYLAVAAWNFISALISYLPSQLQQQMVFLNSSCVGPGAGCLNVAVINLVNSWTNFLSNMIARVDVARFPFIDAILMTAIWLGLAKLFADATSGTRLINALNRGYRSVTASLRSISYPARMNTLLSAVLLLSGYLCLTSIIAIPSLTESSDSRLLSAQEFKDRLKDVILPEAGFDLRFPSDISGENRLDKNELFAKASTSTDPAYANLANFGNDLKRRISNVERQWQELRANFRRDQNTVAELSFQIYELNNKGRKGERETRQHLLNIDIWYHRWWAQNAGQLNSCKSDLERFASNVTSQFESFAAFSTSTITAQASKSQPAAIPTDFFNEISRRLNQSEINASRNCASIGEGWDIPTREDFGGYLGVFGLAASWLLKTESLPLVLITGLLGFGLLGAACSSVIRNVPGRSRGDPLVPNLAGVVIRGTSAAVLIFLAVFGGLAVFTGASATPNPYVVLFTCLVAAVFSEDAWTWGAQRFRSRLNERAPRTAAQRRAAKSPGRQE